MKLAVFLLPLLAVACTVDRSDNTSDDSNEIQGGKSEASYRSVGLLNTGCTGTLISPTIVLTAGHCVESPVATFTLWDGTAYRTVNAAAQRAFPGYSTAASLGCPSRVRDLGMVQLATAVEGIKPMAMGVGVPEAGTMVFAVGYGTHTDATGKNTFPRNSAWETITGLGDHTTIVKWGSGVADHGDSGGPLVSNNEIIGTVSCNDLPYPNPNRRVHYERIDQGDAATWIQSVIAEWSAPAPATGDASTP